MKMTGIGSLPFKNSNEAENFSLRHHLPFIPELPQLQENFLLNSSEELIERLKMYDTITNKPQFKVQLIGPITYKHMNQNSEKKIDYHQILNEILSSLTKIKNSSHQTIYVQLDEPIPPTDFQEQSQLENVMRTITSLEFLVVVHSCQKIQFDFFPEWPTAYLALDLNLNPEFSLNQKLLIAGIDPRLDKINTQAEFVSFTCGMGLLTMDDCEEIYQKLSETIKNSP